jgi:beta-xylosidase
LIHREEKSHLVATGGLYAPTIRYHNGTFYIVCTNVVHQSLDGSNNELQNFIISTTDIHASKWSNPVYFDFHGIDPSLFFDTNTNKAYLCGSKSPGPSTKITLFEIDINTGEKLTEEQELWHGAGGIYPEGPHIYFKDSLYYLMIAEGGTHEGHSVTMARSKSIWGPYEASPLNPVLSAAGTSEYVQATGHCEAFVDKNGEWWGVCLGVRQRLENLWGLGRETFLVKGRWTEDGWLGFERAGICVEGFEDVREQARLTSTPGADMLYIHDPVLERYRISDRDISLTASPHDLTAPEESPSFMGKRQRQLDGTSSVTLRNPRCHSDSAKLIAGLAVYKDELRWLRISYTPFTRIVTLQVSNKAQGIDRSIKHEIKDDFEKLMFVLDYTEIEYVVKYKVDGGEVKELGKVQTMELSDKDFVGPVIGVCVVSEESEEVEFENFVVDGV